MLKGEKTTDFNQTLHIHQLFTLSFTTLNLNKPGAVAADRLRCRGPWFLSKEAGKSTFKIGNYNLKHCDKIATCSEHVY